MYLMQVKKFKKYRKVAKYLYGYLKSHISQNKQINRSCKYNVFNELENSGNRIGICQFIAI